MGKAALGRFQPMLFKPVVEIGLSGVVASHDESLRGTIRQ
jgi:hypothetical protein